MYLLNLELLEAAAAAAASCCCWNIYVNFSIKRSRAYELELREPGLGTQTEHTHNTRQQKSGFSFFSSFFVFLLFWVMIFWMENYKLNLMLNDLRAMLNNVSLFELVQEAAAT